MLFKAVRLMAVGAAIGIVANRLWSELKKPAPEQFPGLRRGVNEAVNPWLIEHGIPGSAHAEIATLEHVGRMTGSRTPRPASASHVPRRVLLMAG